MSYFHVQYHSQALNGGGELGVLLPEHWEDYQRCKVLFLFHGAFGEYIGNIMNSSIYRHCSKRGIAIVAPSAYLGVYTDMVHGEATYSYVKEAVETASRLFPILSRNPRERFLLGISMGGHGAYKLALEHPDQFAAAAACSSPIDVVRTMELLESGQHPGGKELFHAFESSDHYRGTVGDLVEAARRKHAQGIPLPRLFLCWGDTDHARPEDEVTVEKFKALGYPLVTHMGKGGHDYDLWDPMLESIVDWLLEGGDFHGAD